MRPHRNPQRRPEAWHRSPVVRRSFSVIVALIISLCVCYLDALASTRTLFTPTGAAANDRLGWSVARAGDVNGDGYADVIVGAPLADAAPGLDVGRAYIYYGGPSADAVPDVTLTGAAAYDWFGASVGTAGDVNGDGYADVIVGALYSDTAGGSDGGRAYIYYGGTAPDDVADLVMTGAAPLSHFGFSVGTAGDMNGDGYADVIVGAPDTSRAYVYYGGPGADAVPDLTLAGLTADDYFGYSVGTAGDLNGDGYADVIVGAPVTGGSGHACVYYGGPGADTVADLILDAAAADDSFGSSVDTAGDMNGDGYADVIVGASGSDAGGSNAGRAYIYYGGVSPDAVPDQTLTGAAAGDEFGGAVRTAGDFDGDGHADVIVGAQGSDAGGQGAGRAYVFFGGPGTDAAADVTLTGAAAFEAFGNSVGTAGDVDGDGSDDVVVAAYGNDAGGTDAGRAYVTASGTPLVPPNPFTRESAWAPNGAVNAIAQSGNTLYIGGSFSLVGPVSGPAVAIDYQTATAQKPFPRVTGKVRAVEPDGSGGWYIAGAFTMVQGQMRNNLAHIDASGSLTSWNPDVNGEVDDIAVGSGVVYVGGAFSFVGPALRSYVAAISTTSGIATSWTCSPDGPVTEVELGGTAVFIAGAFNTINGQPYARLGALNIASGGPTGLFLGANPSLTSIDALEFSQGKLFVTFTYTFGYYVKVLNEDPLEWLPYDLSASGPIYDVAFEPGGTLAFVGGSFSSFNGQPRSNLAAFVVSTGAPWTTWDIPTDGPVQSIYAYYLDLGGGSYTAGLMVGGTFNTVGGLPRKGLAYLSGGASSVFPWDIACGGDVYAIEAYGPKIYLGGDFSIINAVPRSNLAAIDATAGSLLDWSPTTNARVDALMVSGNTVYLGGQFSTVNGTIRNRAASVDALTGALNAFDPNIDTNFPTSVLAFARDANLVYIAGAFGSVGGVPRGSMAAVDATTGGLSPWNPNVNGTVHAMRIIVPFNLNPPTIVIGGQFTSAGGQPRSNLASLSASTGLANSWNPGANASVHSLIVIPNASGGINRVYAGGNFTTIGGQNRNLLAIIDGAGAATAWNPNLNGPVYALALSGNTVVAGGAFTSIGATPRNHIAAIDASTAVATAWDPNAAGGSPPGVVYSLLKNAGTVYAGGAFTTIAGTPQAYFAGILDGTITGVEEVERDRAPDVAPRALRVAPNPFEHSTMVQFSLVSGGKTHVAVFDVAGRRIRELHSGWLPVGRHTMPWDGRDASGHPVAAGIYFLGVRTEAGQLGSKVYRVK